MLFTLLAGANAFQGIIGDPEDWVQDIITNMVKKTARRVTNGIINTASSSVHDLISSNCQNLFPSLGLLIFTLYFFCLNGFMTVLEFLMNFFSKPQTRDPDHEATSTTYSKLAGHPSSSNRIPGSGQGSSSARHNGNS